MFECGTLCSISFIWFIYISCSTFERSFTRSRTFQYFVFKNSTDTPCQSSTIYYDTWKLEFYLHEWFNINLQKRMYVFVVLSWNCLYSCSLIFFIGKIDPGWHRQLNESQSNRYSLVCNVVIAVATETADIERLNDLAILSAELTASCSSLASEWLGINKLVLNLIFIIDLILINDYFLNINRGVNGIVLFF